MLKKICLSVLFIASAFNVQAFDKSNVNLDKEFWGTWSLYNPKTQCTETFEFKKPGNFVYKVNKKNLAGGFAVVRSNAPTQLDILLMDIATDNKLEGCAGDKRDYSKERIELALKWISPHAAEICTDAEGKQCSGLFLTKK
jgi:hypothetical protein